MAEEEQHEVLGEVEETPEISRGLKPDNKVNLSKVENLHLLDERGNKYRFGDLYKDYKTVVVFVRHFLCFMAKEYVDDLATIPNSFFREANVRMVVIGCAPYKFIRPFRETTGYKYILLTDPECAIHKALGLFNKTTIEPIDMKASKHVKSNYISGVLKSTWRGMTFREMQGDVHQQGASFIIGPGDVVHHSHLDRSAADHAPINDLLCIADVQQFNFPNDRRVIEL